MKSRKISALAIAALMLAAGCQKEQGQVTLGAKIVDNDSKVYIDGSTPKWHEGDPVWVNGDGTRTLTDVNGTNAKIREVAQADQYVAIYPAEYASGTAQNATITIAATQTYAADNNGNQIVKTPMAAVSSSSHLFFYNLCSLVKVTVENNTGADLELQSISVKASADNLSGTAALTVDGESTAAGAITADGSTTATLTFENCTVANGAAPEYYVAVAPFASSNDITITVTTTDNKVFARTRTISSLAGNTIASARLNVDHLEDMAILGAVSVSATQQVILAPGNLQYQVGAYSSAGHFRFAEHQYDYIGSDISTGTVSGSNNQVLRANDLQYQTGNNWIDFFGWGTSGGYYSHTQPNTGSTATGYMIRKGCFANHTNTNYGPSATGDLTGDYDWGVNNEYYLGEGWRTLTSAEWTYMMQTRTASTINGTANARFACVTLTIGAKSIKGTFIFPDHINWPASVTYPNTINTNDANFSTTYTESDWERLEAAGVWFLPAAGYRNVGSSNSQNTFSNIQTFGYYWTATHSATSGKAYYGSSRSGVVNELDRKKGLSVRLVKNL